MLTKQQLDKFREDIVFETQLVGRPFVFRSTWGLFSPREIDEALLQHPALLEAAVVGIPDDNYGQEIMACVVLRPGLVADEVVLREFCAAELGRYKAPKFVRFVDELPRGPSGKVQRLKLAVLAPAA